MTVAIFRPSLNTRLARAVRALFASGEQGAWFDCSDLSTLFQDSAGTTPVTAAGQSVGKMLDKSGRGNHATQATAAARPTLQVDNGYYYLDFDGVDDSLITGAINFSVSDEMSFFAGVKKDSDAIIGCICELSATTGAANPGSFIVAAPGSSFNNFVCRCAGTLGPAEEVGGIAPAPATRVMTVSMKIATDTNIVRLNGAQVASGTSDFGSGNFGNYPFYVGMRGGLGLPFNGRLYSLIVRGALSDAVQIANTESYVNSKTGAY